VLALTKVSSISPPEIQKGLFMLKTKTRVAARAFKILALTASLTALTGGVALGGETLDKIKKDGVIKVGVAASPGFSSPDSNGKWQGFFVDFGRALAITVFNDPDKAQFAASSPDSNGK